MSRVALVTASTTFEARLCGGMNGDAIEVRRVWEEEFVRVDPTKIVDDVARGGAEVVWVGPGLDLDVLIDLADAFDREHPEITVLLAAQPTPVLLERALRVAVRDVVDPHQPKETLAAATRRALTAAERRRASIAAEVKTAAPTTPARVITVVAPKGGAGKTTVATNLAVELARLLPGEVAIADLDLQFGDVGSALSLTPEHTLSDVGRATSDIDGTVLKVFMAGHPSGLYALCAPDTPAEADDVTYDDLANVIGVLREEFAVTIIDTDGGLSEHTLGAMDASTDLVFVSTMDVGSVRSLRKAIEAIDQLGMTSQRRWFVLNRSDAKVGLETNDVEAVIGMNASVTIPSSRLVPISSNQGSPVVESEPRSPVAKQLKALAHLLAPEAGAPPAASGGEEQSVIRRWRKAAAR